MVYSWVYFFLAIGTAFTVTSSMRAELLGVIVSLFLMACGALITSVGIKEVIQDALGNYFSEKEDKENPERDNP